MYKILSLLWQAEAKVGIKSCRFTSISNVQAMMLAN